MPLVHSRVTVSRADEKKTVALILKEVDSALYDWDLE